MAYTTLGDTGMTVSKIAVGCGRFGRNDESKLAVERLLSSSDCI